MSQKNNNIIIWCEKYRPSKIDDCVLSKSLKKTFKSILKKKEVPNMLLCGKPGSGKTTVAKALCSELGLEYIFINGSDESGIDTLRTKIKSFCSTMSLIGKRKVVILDEADYLQVNSTQPALRAFIEEFSKSCSFIFTCNSKHKIIDAIHSRCTVLDFGIPKEEKLELAKQMLARIEEILNLESVTYKKEVLQTILVRYFPDFRRLINELQRYANIHNCIDEHLLTASFDLDISKIYKALKDKNYTSMREWTVEVCQYGVQDIYRKLYESLEKYMTAPSVPSAVLIIGEWQYKSAFSDPEICLLACLVEILGSCEFK